MFSIFRKKKNNKQQGSEAEHDRTARLEEERKQDMEQRLAEERKQEMERRLAEEQRLREEKIKRQEILKLKLAEKRNAEERRLQEEETKQQEVRKEELARLKAINYVQIMLSPVKIMDDERTRFITTDLIITYDDINLHQFEFAGKIITHKANGLISIDQGEPLDDVDTVVFIHEGAESIAYFILNSSQIDQLREYYDKVNGSIRRRQFEFEQEVSNCVFEMKSNAEIYALCYNFIGKNNLAFYYDPEYMCSIEMVISATTSRLGEGTLICPKELELESEKAFEEAKNFIGDDFLLFTQILITRYSGFPKDKDGVASLDKALYIIWKLLRTIAEENYFHDLFLNINPNLKGVLNNSSLDEFILLYSQNDLIDSSSAVNVAALAYYLKRENKFEDRDLTFFDCLSKVLSCLIEIENVNKLRRYEDELLSSNNTKRITINDIDLMSGLEFETFVARLFETMGFRAEVTKASGDQGIDVIAEKDGNKFGIQAKCYSSSVTNKAIQEVVAGINHYHLKRGIVVTNNFFTESAVELAKSNNIILWDRNMLKEKISELA